MGMVSVRRRVVSNALWRLSPTRIIQDISIKAGEVHTHILYSPANSPIRATGAFHLRTRLRFVCVVRNKG